MVKPSRLTGTLSESPLRLGSHGVLRLWACTASAMKIRTETVYIAAVLPLNGRLGRCFAPFSIQTSTHFHSPSSNLNVDPSHFPYHVELPL